MKVDFEHPGLQNEGLNNVVEIDPSAKIDPSVKIIFKGDNHILQVGANTVLRNLTISFSGQGNTVVVGAFCNLRGAMYVRQKGSRIVIADQTTFVNSNLFAMEGKAIEIGEDCMFSSGIFLRTSDEHPVFDLKTDERINLAANIKIADTVWLGEGVTVSKGVSIAQGCVVGARSYVNKSLKRESSVYAGSPARLIREGIRWSRKL